jgi:hypothetical protein
VNNLKLVRQGLWVANLEAGYSIQVEPQGGPVMSVEQRFELAQRIVACVNACDGYPTADLEDVARLGGIPAVKTGIEVQLACMKSVTDQRDELLAALVGIVNAYDAPNKSLAQPIVAARKAITKAKGKPFTEMGGVCQCDTCGTLWDEREAGGHTCKGGAA